MGYPYGGGWKSTTPIYSIKGGLKSPAPAGWFWSPFAKHCTLSGSISQNGITVLVLDGIDNLGFSGGPVVVGKGTSLQVFAVISSYHAEPLEVLPAPDHTQAYISPVPPPLPGQRSSPKQVVESNSGLILAYDITSAIKAIHANPIGPLLLIEPSGNVK